MEFCARICVIPNPIRQMWWLRRCIRLQWRVSQCFRRQNKLDLEQKKRLPNAQFPDLQEEWRHNPYSPIDHDRKALGGSSKPVDFGCSVQTCDPQNQDREGVIDLL